MMEEKQDNSCLTEEKDEYLISYAGENEEFSEICYLRERSNFLLIFKVF